MSPISVPRPRSPSIISHAFSLYTVTNPTPDSYIVVYSWIASSFPRPPAKRAVAIALINGFGQLGNVAGSYVWNLKENGYRKSYGIVTAMFGATIIGCIAFRAILVAENRKLEQDERAAWEVNADVAAQTAETAHVGAGEAARRREGFRYLV